MKALVRYQQLRDAVKGKLLGFVAIVVGKTQRSSHSIHLLQQQQRAYQRYAPCRELSGNYKYYIPHLAYFDWCNECCIVFSC